MCIEVFEEFSKHEPSWSSLKLSGRTQPRSAPHTAAAPRSQTALGTFKQRMHQIMRTVVET